MLDLPVPKNYWYVACRSRQLRRRPRRTRLFGETIVLFRGRSGAVGALRDLCPHRSVPLASGWVEGERIVCPYHGWQFDVRGACQLIPGLDGGKPHVTRKARCYAVREQQGLVWVYGDPDCEPARMPYQIPHLGDPGYRSLVLDFPIEAELPDALENFLDTTHTHFVHGGVIRDGNERRCIAALVRGYANHAEVEYLDDGQDSGLMARLLGGGVDRSIDRFILPSIAQLEHRAGERVRLLITLLITPETATSLRVHAVFSGASSLWRYLQAATLGRLLLARVLRQDREILRLQLHNKRVHPDARYASTRIDLLRPQIMRLLRRATLAPGKRPPTPERRVELSI